MPYLPEAPAPSSRGAFSRPQLQSRPQVDPHYAQQTSNLKMGRTPIGAQPGTTKDLFVLASRNRGKAEGEM